jgi:PleD family two-component response regulator
MEEPITNPMPLSAPSSMIRVMSRRSIEVLPICSKRLECRIDGFEVCRRIKADPATADIPVILVTPLSDVDFLVRGFEAGADDFITTPCNALDLMARVRSQLRRKRDYEHIRALADPLTGAFNRRYFDAQAPRLAARCRADRVVH